MFDRGNLNVTYRRAREGNSRKRYTVGFPCAGTIDTNILLLLYQSSSLTVRNECDGFVYGNECIFMTPASVWMI